MGASARKPARKIILQQRDDDDGDFDMVDIEDDGDTPEVAQMAEVVKRFKRA